MPVAAPEQFFQESRSFAAVKQEMFGKYLDVWCALHLEKQKDKPRLPLVLLDLEAGTDLVISENGCEINPYIYKTILKRTQLQQPVQAYVYSRTKTELTQLSDTIELLPFYTELEIPPLPLSNSENKDKLATDLEAGNPSLLFLDPFNGSYALHVLEQTITMGNSDLFMLLQPDTLIRAAAARKPAKAIATLLGDRLQSIHTYCRKEKSKSRRTDFILEQVLSALQAQHYFSQHFKINLPGSNVAEFYLLFASRNSHACRVFKEMLQPYSVLQDDDVPLFTANTFVQQQTELFEHRPKYSIQHLVQQVLEQEALYKYKSIEQIYTTGHSGTPYTRQNYLEAIEQLRKAGKVELLNGSTMQPVKRAVPTAKVKFRG